MNDTFTTYDLQRLCQRTDPAAADAHERMFLLRGYALCRELTLLGGPLFPDLAQRAERCARLLLADAERSSDPEVAAPLLSALLECATANLPASLLDRAIEAADQLIERAAPLSGSLVRLVCACALLMPEEAYAATARQAIEAWPPADRLPEMWRRAAAIALYGEVAGTCAFASEAETLRSRCFDGLRPDIPLPQRMELLEAAHMGGRYDFLKTDCKPPFCAIAPGYRLWLAAAELTEEAWRQE